MQDEKSSSVEFDQYSSSYEELLEDPMRSRFTGDPKYFHRRKWLLIEQLLKQSGVDPKTQRWLDVGCGKGDLLAIAAPHFAEGFGCDPSAGMLSSAAGASIHLQPSPVKLPFEDASIDFVTAVCVYHHVHGADRELLTYEIARVLRPGGLCCIIEHNPWNPVTQAIVRRCPVDADAELLSTGQSARLLAGAGLKVQRKVNFLFLPETWFRRLGAAERLLRGVPLGGQYAVLARMPA